MKAKLTMIGLAMALGVWMAIGDSPRVRTMEQRVSELEQIVASQSQQLEAQQREIDGIVPLKDIFSVENSIPGYYPTLIIKADAVVYGWFQCDYDLMVLNNIRCYGQIINGL